MMKTKSVDVAQGEGFDRKRITNSSIEYLNRLNVRAVCISRVLFFGKTRTADTRDVIVS